MTSTSARSADPSSASIVHRGEAAAGPFMVTLCRLVAPTLIRPPQSPQLRPFTFLTTRARQPDGSEQQYLHMGFFETLAYAERWARAVRGRHPDAIATLTPPAFWLPEAESSAGRSVDPGAESPVRQSFAPVDAELSDTQVLSILEARRAGPPPTDGREQGSEQIELLRPEDTGTRLALKAAVVRGAPVSFAVQLHWSARPIEAGSVPSLALLKAHTLYTVESRRANRSCFFLRLGFFRDPASAREVASLVRFSFVSAAVVPVLEEEIARARAACTDPSSIPCLVQQHLDQALEPTAVGMAVAKPASEEPRGASRGAETLEQTLAQLAERALWNDPDFLSDTGVRHLKVEVQERASSRRH